MAIESEKLLIQLEARIRDFEKNFARAARTSDRDLGRIEKRVKLATSRIEAGFGRMGAGLVAGLASGLSLRAAQQLIDSSTRITNSLKVAGLAGQDLEKVYKSLFDSAQRNAAPLESLVELYGRIALVQGELGASTEELLGFTDSVSLALRVAGTDAGAASGALMQLGQAMGGGIVRAEEFNSIMEGAQPIAQAVAAGLDEAGGSVAKLRQLVVDGKISSEAFFRAFEAGSVTLRDKVATSETTISSSFVRLQNVLIDTAGKFNSTSGAGQRFAQMLDNLGTSITNLVNSPAFDNALNDLGDAIGETFAKDMADIQRIIGLIEGLAAKFDTLGDSVTDAELELAQAEQAVANLATNTRGQFGEVDAAFQDLIEQILKGKGTAESAAAAIEALGQANPDFANLQASISGVVSHFIALRDAARAAHAAASNTDAIGEGATWSEFSGTFKPATPVKPITLSDYPIAPGAGSGSGSGSGGSGGGGRAGSATQERDAIVELITELQRELDLIGASEVERRIDAELRRAGANATDQQKDSIRNLVTEIDSQTAAMERLEQAQENAKGIAKDFLGGIIGDLRNGSSAVEALSNAFGRLADRLIDMALDQAINALISSFMGGGTGGGLLSILGLSNGGEVQHLASGGPVRGTGTARSDSVPAMLSQGEFVINSAATAKNRALLEAINSGQVGRFADGGMVGSKSIAQASRSGAVTIAPTISIKVEGGSRGEQADQALGENIAKQVEGSIRGLVQSEIMRQRRPGNSLNNRGMGT
jgi:tape measure domain-containing protein